MQAARAIAYQPSNNPGMRGTSTVFPGYAQYETATLIDAFAQGPARVRAALQGLTEQELRSRPRGTSTWSIHEIVHHLVDSEIQGAFRVRKILSEDAPMLPSYDQDRWATALAYDTRGDAASRELALTLFARLREWTIAHFRAASEDDWARTGTHAEYGPISLRNTLELYADHAERHLEQIHSIRQLLGRPLSQQILLTQRLY